MKLGSAIKIAAMANERSEIARELRRTKRFDLRKEIAKKKIEKRSRWEFVRGKRYKKRTRKRIGISLASPHQNDKTNKGREEGKRIACLVTDILNIMVAD